MINSNNYIKLIFIWFLVIIISGCSDPWNDRIDDSENNQIKQNLSEQLVSNPETSQFGQLLRETGYDSILNSSKTYTVWVPNNEAMNQVDENLLSDIEQSRLFIKNHIALSTFTSTSNLDTVTVHMLNDKYLQFINGNKIDESQLITSDHYASNGIFHIINQALVPKLNIWEYLMENISEYEVSNYLETLDDFNIYHRADSIAKANPEAQNIFADSLTNSYLFNVYNLNNEKNKYTFFLMEDDIFIEETNKLKPYLNKGQTDSTEVFAKYFNLRDLSFQQIFARENLPDTLTSQFGVKIPINKQQIIEEIPLSNGIIYRMSSLNIPLNSRLVTTIIQGEEPNSFSRNDREEFIFYREKSDPNGNIVNDIMVRNHGIARFSINYSARDMYSTTYQVYWRAVNDIQSNTFQQQLRIGGRRSSVEGEESNIIDPITTLPYTNVPPDVYEEVYVGEFTLEQAGNIDFISLIAANTGSNGNNTLTLDYLRLVPVIQ
ncbi:fasciclin domain-containing protein [Zunongwangia atlantica]|uniref:Beta-Ig-H3/fasciclin n=1 Tax=Zunongwangia atlantica 22II14-10F7 TaxID=1185767 RepID=A0A1Y1T0Y5_9FLAO|nr:fasciclin domain-containing protein [Zunongwangia atlantica]ORL44143.1 beta-Ig-H3/fasciclin [Zunongwangia atlantica 22II14-10F7]